MTATDTWTNEKIARHLRNGARLFDESTVLEIPQMPIPLIASSVIVTEQEIIFVVNR